jgi:hypothetical protein
MFVCHAMACRFASRDEGIIALHDLAGSIPADPIVMWCHLTRETRVPSALDDMASNNRQAPQRGAG